MVHFFCSFNPWTAPSTLTAIGRSRFENPFPQLNRFRALRTLIEQRPQDAFLRSVLADVLYRNQQYLKAKAILDAVIEDQPSDGEFWIIDAVVHEKIAQTAEDREPHCWRGRRRQPRKRSV